MGNAHEHMGVGTSLRVGVASHTILAQDLVVCVGLDMCKTKTHVGNACGMKVCAWLVTIYMG